MLVCESQICLHECDTWQQRNKPWLHQHIPVYFKHKVDHPKPQKPNSNLDPSDLMPKSKSWAFLEMACWEKSLGSSPRLVPVAFSSPAPRLPPPLPSTPVCRDPSSLPRLLDSGHDHLLRMTQIPPYAHPCLVAVFRIPNWADSPRRWLFLAFIS